MPAFSESSLKQLATVDPRLADVLREVIKYFDFQVIEGHRGQAAQDEAFRTGKSKLKWPNGNHNRLPSTAVDVAPLSVDLSRGKIDWGDKIAFGRLMGAIEIIARMRGIKLRFGVDWDGDWRSVDRDNDESFLDAPHVELA